MSRRGVLGGAAGAVAAGAAIAVAVASEGEGRNTSLPATAKGGQISLSPSGNATGATDAAAINEAFSHGYREVVLLPGTFYLGTEVIVPDNRTLTGSGMGTILVPASGISSPMMRLSGYNTMIRNLQVFGGSNATGANPRADVFSPLAGAVRWWISDIAVNYCNGWVVNPEPPVTPLHGSIRSVQGTNNAGGISLAGGTSHGGQVNVVDVNLQSCERHEALLLRDITDVAVSGFNASVTGSAAVPAVHVSGSSQAITMDGVNVGVVGSPAPDVAVLLIDAAGGESPSEIDFSGCVFQDGGIGVVVNDDSERLRFRGVIAKSNLGDGWRLNGTGTAILVDGCQASANNRAGGTASDVLVTSTAHVGLFAFAYASGAVTSSRRIALAGNNVTDAYPTHPGRRPAAGASPNGW